MIDIYGTLGPSCADRATLSAMLQAGMTGIRLNLSHGTLREARPMLEEYRAAAESLHRRPGLLIDLMGPELRIGSLSAPIPLNAGDVCLLCTDPDGAAATCAALANTAPVGAAATCAAPANTAPAGTAAGTVIKVSSRMSSMTVTSLAFQIFFFIAASFVQNICSGFIIEAWF